MMAMMTADWVPLNSDVFFRKVEFYNMKWSDMMDISKYLIILAPFGGPIAVLRDDKRIIKFQISGLKPILHLFTHDGKELSAIHWNNGKIVFLAWTSLRTENLVCLQDDGTVLIYDMFGNFRRNFSLKNMFSVEDGSRGNSTASSKIIDCQVVYYRDAPTTPRSKLKDQNKSRTNPSRSSDSSSISSVKTRTALAILIRVTTTNSHHHQHTASPTSHTAYNKLYYVADVEGANLRAENFFESPNASFSNASFPTIPSHRYGSQCFLAEQDLIPLWHLVLNKNNSPSILCAKEHETYIYVFNRAGMEQKYFISIHRQYATFQESKISYDQTKLFLLTDVGVLWIGCIRFHDTFDGGPAIYKISECDINDKFVMDDYNIRDDTPSKINTVPNVKQFEDLSISINTITKYVPQLVWCGNYAIVMLLPHSHHLNLVCWEGSGGGGSEENAEIPNTDCPCYSLYLNVDTAGDDIATLGALVSESDGCHLLTRFANKFIHAVPRDVVEVFRIGSICPAALLLDASQAFFGMGDGRRADEYLRTLGCCDPKTLKRALVTCVMAACQEFDMKNQKILLRAVSFGKATLSTAKNNSPDQNETSCRDGSTHYLSQSFVHVCQLLRILNAIRHSETACIPLTFGQYLLLDKYFPPTSDDDHHMDLFNFYSVGIIVERLINRRHFALAVEISEYIGSDPEGSRLTGKVLSSWACYKAGQLQLSDGELARVISSKLGPSPGILYSEIAYHALEAGRPELANLLSEFESNVGEKVNLLLQMGKYKEALEQACLVGAQRGDPTVKDQNGTSLKGIPKKINDSSPDPELIFLVFIKMAKNLCPPTITSNPQPLSDSFMSIVEQGPAVAKFLFPKFCDNYLCTSATTASQPDKLSDVGGRGRNVKHAPDPVIQSKLNFYKRSGNVEEMAYTLLQIDTKETTVETKIRSLKKICEYLKNSSNEFYSKQIEDQIKLLGLQQKFTAMNINCNNLSLLQTMSVLVEKKQYKLADDLKKEFKVSDKRYWWLKITALSRAKDWEELEKFSRHKKSPIGYEPFVDLCLENDDVEQSLKYLTRVTNDNKVKYYLKVGLVDEACQVAFQQKNTEHLDHILNTYANGDDKRKLREKIQIYKNQLKK